MSERSKKRDSSGALQGKEDISSKSCEYNRRFSNQDERDSSGKPYLS